MFLYRYWYQLKNFWKPKSLKSGSRVGDLENFGIINWLIWVLQKIDILSFQSKSNNSFVEKQHPMQCILHICWCVLELLISRFLIGQWIPYQILLPENLIKQTRSFNDIIHICTIVNKFFTTSSESNCCCGYQWSHIITRIFRSNFRQIFSDFTHSFLAFGSAPFANKSFIMVWACSNLLFNVQSVAFWPYK